MPLLWEDGRRCTNPICCSPICEQCGKVIEEVAIMIFNEWKREGGSIFISCNPACGKIEGVIKKTVIKLFDDGRIYHWFCSPCIICGEEISMLKGHINTPAGRCHWGECFAIARAKGLI